MLVRYNYKHYTYEFIEKLLSYKVTTNEVYRLNGEEFVFDIDYKYNYMHTMDQLVIDVILTDLKFKRVMTLYKIMNT
jgi:hypothetical protein